MNLKKIFNLFYKDKSSIDKLCRYRSLFNIIATKYLIKSNYKIIKEYILFGKTIVRRTDENGIRIWKTKFGIFKKQSLKEIFKKKFYKYYKDFDDIYLLQGNSGEICLFFDFILKKLIEKHNSKRPLILTNRKYHLDMAQMFYPEIPCKFIKDLSVPVQEKEFEIDNYHFTFVMPKWHFNNFERKALKSEVGKVNYFQPILDLFDVNINEINPREIVVSNEIELSMLKKIKKTGLNLDNFIFISPEAESCDAISSDFWVELIKKFQKQGFDIFVNLTKKCELSEKIEFKTAFLSFKEAYALARHSKKIIALRSGLCEFLSKTNVPMDILYTSFRKRRKRHFWIDIDYYHVMAMFSFKNIPCINMDIIKEICAEGDFQDIYNELKV